MRKLRRFGFLLFVTALLLTLSPKLPFTESMDVYASAYDAFINDSRWAHGTAWGYGQRPKLEPSAEYYDCAAYAFDFARYNFGAAYPQAGEAFYDINAVRAGDVITIGNPGTSAGHWFCVLERNGNKLYTAEGNFDSKVRVGWNYTISGAKFAESTYYFNCGYHFEPVAPSSHTLDVNGLLDGTLTGNTSGFGTFDIYINGSLAGNDVNDYCNRDCKPGTTWEIKDIRVNNGKSFDGIAAGSRKGTLSGDMSIQLKFTTIPALESGTATTTKVYNGHTYIYVQRDSTWYAAKQFSERLGGHLVTVTSAGEDSFIKDLTGGKAVWIGLSDKASEGNWRWLTGESYSYRNWNSGEPNDSAGDEGEEDYAHYSAGGKWNDNGGYMKYQFVCEIDQAYTVKYDANGGVGAPAAQAKGQGVTLRLSTKTPTRDCHTFVGWATSPEATTANYKAGGIYSRNANVTLYAVWKEGLYTDWSTTKPTGVDSALIETKAQYRYATLQSPAWKQSGTSTLDYVKSWPAGFNTGNSLYQQYHKTPVSASEMATAKTTVSEGVCGYIYWHWCAGTFSGGPINRVISDCQEPDYSSFHAFYSAQNAGQTDLDGRNGGNAFYYPNSSVCKDSYWYLKTPVYRQTIVNYTRDAAQDTWSSWSSWSDFRMIETSTHKVQTRTLYRYLNEDCHKWDAGKVTKKATTTSTGVKTYTCTLCGKTRTETIAKLRLDISKATVGSIGSKTYTGKAITPDPKVVYNGKILRKGTDYKVSYANNIKAGTATITITGIGSYKGTLTKTFKIVKTAPSYVRIAGADRYATSLQIADAYKKALGVSKFSAVCVADGQNFPDALAGAYFASQNKAPIIDVRSNAPAGPQTMNAINYIKKNLKTGGTVYILGGPGSVPASVQTTLKKAGFKVQRLWGQNRYLSNIEILKAAKVKTGTEFIVTTGTTFADALTASATGKPVLLVAGNALTKEQKAYLAKAGVKKFTIVGTTKEVSTGIENQLKKYASVSHISGANAYERSISVAKKYFPCTRNHINIADGRNFPDALCAGPLAIKKGGPLFLTDGSTTVNAKIRAYTKAAKTMKATVYGGPASVSDATAKYILGIN